MAAEHCPLSASCSSTASHLGALVSWIRDVNWFVGRHCLPTRILDRHGVEHLVCVVQTDVVQYRFDHLGVALTGCRC